MIDICNMLERINDADIGCPGVIETVYVTIGIYSGVLQRERNNIACFSEHLQAGMRCPGMLESVSDITG